MWSEKKTINTVINILLFLLGANVFHLGQFLLPIICLVVFIDNKCKFKVINFVVFIILCLFGISFFVFSYKLGFYCVMGFCLPMAYYIGSNLKDRKEENIVKIIYILGFGMAFHVILNFVYELVIIGIPVFNKINHYDIWTGDKISTTATAINYTLLIASIYYIISYEKNKKFKYIGIALFIIIFFYNFALGRRTPILLLLISFFISILLDYIILKVRKVDTKKIELLICIIIAIIVTFIIIYSLNLFDIQERFIYINLILKFYNFGLNPERLQIFIDAVKLAPSYLWGGQQISTILDVQIHDLWMDTYDYAGVIPFIFLLVYTIIEIKNMICAIKKDPMNKTLFINLLLCILIQLLLEPIMTGASIFLICIIIVISCVENVEKESI